MSYLLLLLSLLFSFCFFFLFLQSQFLIWQLFPHLILRLSSFSCISFPPLLVFSCFSCFALFLPSNLPVTLSSPPFPFLLCLPIVRPPFLHILPLLSLTIPQFFSFFSGNINAVEAPDHAFTAKHIHIFYYFIYSPSNPIVIFFLHMEGLFICANIFTLVLYPAINQYRNDIFSSHNPGTWV